MRRKSFAMTVPLILLSLFLAAAFSAAPAFAADSQLLDELREQWRNLQISAFKSPIGVKTWENIKDTAPSPEKSPLRNVVVSGGEASGGEASIGFNLAAGSVIPALLITGINSDLPGYLTAQVSENVFDSPTGRILLIPQGSRLFGEYDSKVIFGQRRPLIRWSRLTFPDGSTLNLSGMPGVDTGGYSGFRASVNSHYGPMFSSAVLVSIFAGIAETIDRDKEGNSVIVSQPTITLSDSVPVGMIMLRMGKVPPPDWHVLDGSLIDVSGADSEFKALSGGAKKFPFMKAAPGYIWCVKIRSSKQTLLNKLADAGIDNTAATVKDSSGRYIGAELADVISKMVTPFFEKQLERAPTLVVKPGYRFRVMVNRSLKLPAWKD